MSWLCGQRIVADPTNAAVRGTPFAGGACVHIDVSFQVKEWPWKERGPVSLIPLPSTVTARPDTGGELLLGFATPEPATVLSPATHSTTTNIRFTLMLSTAALVSLEAARNGGGLKLAMTLVAHPLRISQHAGYAAGIEVHATTTMREFGIPKEQWLAVLKNVGYCDTLLTELRLPTTGPEATAPGRQRLAKAVNARNDGSYAEAMRGCRIALDELKNAGFGGKAPQEIVKFLNDKAGSLTQAERFSSLQVALQLFLSPTHHANAPDEHYTREDAELAIAMTAALLRLAPTHRP